MALELPLSLSMKHFLQFKKRNKKLSLILLGFASISLFFNNCAQPGDIQLTTDLSKAAKAPTPGNTDSTDDTDPSMPNTGGQMPDGGNGSPGTNPSNPVTNLKYKQVSDVLDVKSSTNNKVDILIVIDNSGSMSYEQAEMAKRFAGFVDSLNGLDWQLGITTTDVTTDKVFSDGKLLAFAENKYKLTSGDDIAAAKDLFGKTIQRAKSEGSGSEQGTRAVYRSVERAFDSANDITKNAELFRDGASLAVVIVSDADESPFINGGAVASNDPVNLLALLKEKWPQKLATFHSIVVKSDDVNCLYDKNSMNEGYGKTYEYLSKQTSGIVGSVCELDYSSQLRIMGQDIKDKVNSIKLSCAPVDSDKDGMLNFSLKDSQGQSVTNLNINADVVSIMEYLAVGKYSLEYTCVDQAN